MESQKEFQGLSTTANLKQKFHFHLVTQNAKLNKFFTIPLSHKRNIKDKLNQALVP